MYIHIYIYICIYIIIPVSEDHGLRVDAVVVRDLPLLLPLRFPAPLAQRRAHSLLEELDQHVDLLVERLGDIAPGLEDHRVVSVQQVDPGEGPQGARHPPADATTAGVGALTGHRGRHADALHAAAQRALRAQEHHLDAVEEEALRPGDESVDLVVDHIAHVRPQRDVLPVEEVPQELQCRDDDPRRLCRSTVIAVAVVVVVMVVIIVVVVVIIVAAVVVVVVVVEVVVGAWSPFGKGHCSPPLFSFLPWDHTNPPHPQQSYLIN